MTAAHKSNAPAHRSDGLRLRVDVFDKLMAKRGATTVVDQARFLGIHRATIFRLRKGEPGSGHRVAVRMAAACGTTVEKLFEWVEAA